MSLEKTIQRAVRTAYGVVSDLLKNVTYTSVAQTTYDTATGAVIPGADQTKVIDVLRETYNETQVDGQNIKVDDRRYSWPAIDFPFVPKTDDYLTLADGTRWNVLKVGTDPATGHWAVQARV